ncbi:hypothetical protein ACVXHA_23080 [Escherichia coli]
MDDNAAHELESQAATSVTNGAHIYPFKTSRIGELATVNPGTDLTVVDASGKQPIVLLQGYQMQGSENTLYLAAGQRLALATLSEEGIKALTVNGEWQADEYGNQWRQASLQGALTDPALADRKPLWQYAENLTIPIALVAMRLLPLTITPSMHGRPLPEEWVREPA